ncbi:ATPase family AAA domain-containing protein 2-like [Telopea speciosissima]|uniref:ATPase family AAA domain-containing protein 2-like n=1 Tax=Telopea speciosissima TaxID=54955 RepID=UPI001CC62279|nr:ATPase family AAA domain-containing protein 2-like [Telopea speciosissima]
MASEEMDLVPPQKMENGLNSQMVFQDETLQFSGRKTREMSGFADEKMFSVEREQFFRSPSEAEFRRSIFDSSPGRQEQPENQNWNNDDGSTGTPSGAGSEGEDEEDDDDDDDEVDEGDGEVEGLVATDDGNNKNNNSSSSVHISSEKLRNKKANLQKHHSSFGSSRGVLVNNNFIHSTNNIRGSPKEQQQEHQQQRQQGRVNHFENTVAIAEPDMYYIQFPQGSDRSSLAEKEMGGDNDCGFSGRKDGSLSSESGESLRAILSDPVTMMLYVHAICMDGRLINLLA